MHENKGSRGASTSTVNLASTHHLSLHTPMAPLQFQPLASQPTPAFWAALAAHKLNHLRLDDSHLSIAAHLEPAKRVLVNKEHGHDSPDVGIDGSLVVGGDAFEAERGK